MIEVNRQERNRNFYLMGERATTCIAHRISHLAFVAYMDVGEGREQDAEALRIVAIDNYYFSSRLTRHEMRRTLQAIQLRILGL